MNTLNKMTADIHQAEVEIRSVNSLLNEIQKRCEGLNYVSETDSPVTAFKAFHKTENLTADFMRSINRNPFTRFETETFTELFSRLIERDPRWEDLMSFLETNLTECTVLKVGRIQIDYYVVGLFGNLPVGVFIYAIET